MLRKSDDNDDDKSILNENETDVDIEEVTSDTGEGDSLGITLLWKPEEGDMKNEFITVHTTMTLQELNKICVDKKVLPTDALSFRKGDSIIFKGPGDGKMTLRAAGVKEGDTIKIYPRPTDANAPFLTLFFAGIGFFLAGFLVSSLELFFIPLGGILVVAALCFLFYDDQDNNEDCCAKCCTSCCSACLIAS